MKPKTRINVTKTYLPPLKEYGKYLNRIWDANWVTNNGPLVVELEKKLKRSLGVKHLLLVSNGTIALQLAIRALGLKKEIITTPFTYVASTSSIVWEGCKPKFADIDPASLCIDPAGVERAITPETEAVLPVHVYGNVCDVEGIGSIAGKHKLKVIYDASHAFGVTYRGESVMNYGDISTISFHATKIFHTVEGGAVITESDELAEALSYLRDFGHEGTEEFHGLGINGKLSEFHAAMGLCVLPTVKESVHRRKIICNLYAKLLQESLLRMPSLNANAKINYAYYPVIFPSETSMMKVRAKLNTMNIYPRRYFYPSLNTLKYLDYERCPVSEDISRKILCLPLYPDLALSDVDMIARIILGNL